MTRTQDGYVYCILDVLLAIQEARNALWRASDLATSHMRKQAVS